MKTLLCALVVVLSIDPAWAGVGVSDPRAITVIAFESDGSPILVIGSALISGRQRPLTIRCQTLDASYLKEQRSFGDVLLSEQAPPIGEIFCLLLVDPGVNPSRASNVRLEVWP